MKKILLTLLVFINLTCFGQTSKSIFQVNDSLSTFGKTVPKYSYVGDTIGNFWQITEKAEAEDTVYNISRINIRDGNFPDSATVNQIAVASDESGKNLKFSTATINDESVFEIDKTSSITSGYNRTMNLANTQSGTASSFGIQNAMYYSGTDTTTYNIGLNQNVKNIGTGTATWLSGILSYARNEGGGVCKSIHGADFLAKNTLGTFNKLSGIYYNVENTVTDDDNNDIYGVAGAIFNTGKADQAYSLQVKVDNSGVLNEVTGLQTYMYNTGTVEQYIGLEIGKEHNFTGTATNAYAIYIDSSSSIGTTENYSIYNGSEADSYFAGNIKAPLQIMSFSEGNALGHRDLDLTLTNSALRQTSIGQTILNSTGTIYIRTNNSAAKQIKANNGDLYIDGLINYKNIDVESSATIHEFAKELDLLTVDDSITLFTVPSDRRACITPFQSPKVRIFVVEHEGTWSGTALCRLYFTPIGEVETSQEFGVASDIFTIDSQFYVLLASILEPGTTVRAKVTTATTGSTTAKLMLYGTAIY